LGDEEYLNQCRSNGLERIGKAGGGDAMARVFSDLFLKTDPQS
jgi:hypothetical protein